MNVKKEVIKHSAAIHIQNDITLVQRRAWNVLLANAYDDLPLKDVYFMPIHDLAQVMEFDSKNEAYLKEALEALVGCKVKWNVLDKDREIEWGVTTLLAQAKIKNGICTYAYSPEMRTRLHNPRMYARISLSMQNKFNSKHAQALWELCVDYLNETKNYGETPFISLESYRMLMGVAEDMYPEFKRLNTRVVRDPIAEINKFTDFVVESECRKERKKVTALKFRVRRTLELPKSVGKQGTLFPDIEDMPGIVHDLKEIGLAASDAWEIWQKRFDYVDGSKRPQGVEFETYIQEKLHLLKQRQAEGKVKSATGFLLKAIKQNYANPEFVAGDTKKKAREETNTQYLAEHNRYLLEDQKRALQTNRDEELHKLCARIFTEDPALLTEITEAIFKENSVLKKMCQPEKPLFENYQDNLSLRVLVDQCVMDRYPKRFLPIRALYDSQLTALDAQARPANAPRLIEPVRR
ncbi:MAG: replication initiation protein [Deltaproteobacteria bacterium]|nr:replication initiation protein [Deltaproteobacteria bacterium]